MKRARTLQSEVRTLKKQVAINKKELKYFDGRFRTPTEGSGDFNNRSFFKDITDASGLTADPVFVGRKVYIKKMEIRVAPPYVVDSSPNPPRCLIWREKRQGKPVELSETYPLAIDPEYHTMLRHWEKSADNDIGLKHYTIDFGSAGRLLEFDEQSTAVGTGEIVQGDIKLNLLNTSSDGDTDYVFFRVWYTDG